MINRTIKRGFLSGLFSGIHVNGIIKPGLIPVFLVPGVFLGAMSWWFSLSYVLSRFKKKIRLRAIVRIDKLGGGVIIIIGIFLLLSLFTSFSL